MSYLFSLYKKFLEGKQEVPGMEICQIYTSTDPKLFQFGSYDFTVVLPDSNRSIYFSLGNFHAGCSWFILSDLHSGRDGFTRQVQAADIIAKHCNYSHILISDTRSRPGFSVIQENINPHSGRMVYLMIKEVT